MAKSDSKKRAELMAKEWKKSRSTVKSLSDLVDMGLLHNPELGGWRAPEGESYPDPAPVRLLYSKILSRGVLGFLFILFFRGFSCTMRSGFAICTRTQSFSSPLLFICARPMLA